MASVPAPVTAEAKAPGAPLHPTHQGPINAAFRGQASPGRVRARTDLRPDPGTAGALAGPVLRVGPGVGAGAWPVRMLPRLGGLILGGSAGRDLGTTGGASQATGELCGLLPGSRWGGLRPDSREHGGPSPRAAGPGGSPGFRQVQGHPLQARLLRPGSPRQEGASATRERRETDGPGRGADSVGHDAKSRQWMAEAELRLPQIPQLRPHQEAGTGEREETCERRWA